MSLFQLQWYHSSQIYLGLWSWYCLRRDHENQDIRYFIACLNCMICYLLILYVNYTGECLNSRYYQLKITKAVVTVNHEEKKTIMTSAINQVGKTWLIMYIEPVSVISSVHETFLLLIWYIRCTFSEPSPSLLCSN